MQFDNQKTRNIADAAAKILAGETVSEELKGNQHKIDKNKNGKIDSQDFKMLRKEEKKECSCENEHEGDCPVNEEIEQINEYESKDGKFVHNAKAGRYGGSEKPTDPFAGVRGPGKKDIEKIEKEKKKKKPFSEMVGLYQEKGLKSLSEMFIKEEPDNEQFKKELDDAQAKSEGKKKNPDIAKGSVQAVQKEEVEQIEERSMTEPEMKKREEIVKSMKKGMAGFKERYGDRAKEVMYATATARAKGE